MQLVKSNLRTATAEDVPALRRNWAISFGDTNDYLDFFFARKFVPKNTLVACVNEEPVSQLFLLPVALRTQDELLSADYLFAAATHPDYRKCGIMADLLLIAETVCAERGKEAIVLLPGNRSLYSYYESHGYMKTFSRRRWTVSREELAQLSVPVERTDDAARVLQSIFCKSDGLCWDENAIQYALDEHRQFRGLYASSKHAFVRVSDSEAECLCLPEHFGECATLLLGLSDLPNFTIRFPSHVPYGISEDGGMLRNLRKKEIHLRDAFISFAME